MIEAKGACAPSTGHVRVLITQTIGQVLGMSNDSVQQEEGQGGAPVFPVGIALDRSTIKVNGEDQQLTPGMSVTAEVKTGKRRVIEYILTPLLRYRDEAMRER